MTPPCSASITRNRRQSMGRSRGGLTSKIHAVVDTNGLPVRLALTAGEAHDNRLAGKLLSRLRSGTMLLADRGYDADWIRTFAAPGALGPTSRQEAIATTRSASARISIGPAIWSSGSSTKSSNVGASLLAMTSLRPTTSPSSSWHQYGYGYALMSPRPRHDQQLYSRGRQNRSQWVGHRVDELHASSVLTSRLDHS
jgi:hypothetical protein